LLAEDIFDR